MKKKTKKYILSTCLNCRKEFFAAGKPKRMFCSCKCSANDLIKNESTKNTCLKKYGVTNTAAIPLVKAARDKALVTGAKIINQKRREWWTEDNIYNVNETRKKTLLGRYGKGIENCFQIPSVQEKIKKYLDELGVKSFFNVKNESGEYVVRQAFYKKNGVKHPSQVFEYKEKAKQTCLKNWGSEYYLSSVARRIFNEENNGWCPVELILERDLYYKEVQKITFKNKKELFENWDGNCFYTDKKLITDTKQFNNPQYATIDHQYPKSLGFINKVPPEIIGSLSNLVICSRQYNIKKQNKISKELDELL